MTTNRNKIKQWFITFPQTTTTKVEMAERLDALTPKFYYIVQETHKEGGKHLHAVALLAPVRKTDLLAKFKEWYPEDCKRIDIQPTRSIPKAIQYLEKEDKNPITKGEYKEKRGLSTRMLRQFNDFANSIGFSDYVQMFRHYDREEAIQKAAVEERREIAQSRRYAKIQKRKRKVAEEEKKE